MSEPTRSTDHRLPQLGHSFANALPEMATPWQAAEFPEPRLEILNEELAGELGLDVQWLRTPEGLQFLTGQLLPAGAVPVAQGYAGHQFGQLSPRLGDGRALLLGELTTPDGRTVDLHLKGSGRTPWARGGDGLAPLDAALKEYLYAEAVHGLGIPTSRCLAVISTGQQVMRETVVPGGLVVRVADSHLRVGSFQYAALHDLSGDKTPATPVLPRLMDYTIARHFPDIDPTAGSGKDRALALFQAVMDRQAELVALWMRAGFIHGVLNTDNVALSGQTIDFGPCAFMDKADPATVFSQIDTQGRYAFGNQPAIIGWDLARFAECLIPIVGSAEPLQELLGTFGERYSAAYTDAMSQALGISRLDAPTRRELVDAFWREVVAAGADYPATLRALAELAAHGDTIPAAGTAPTAVHRSLAGELPTTDGFTAWLKRWRAATPDAQEALGHTPRWSARNRPVRDAIRQAARSGGAPAGEDTTHGDPEGIEKINLLVQALRHPFGADPTQALSPAAAALADQHLLLPDPGDASPFYTVCGT